MTSLKTIGFFSFLLLAQTRAIPGDFTDADFRRSLTQLDRVLFYSFSPRMALSVEGLKEIQQAASDLRAEAVFLVDSAATEKELQALPEVREMLPRIRYQKSQLLRNTGIQLHYPSVVVANGHRVVGAPIPGFKSRTGYVTLVSDLLKLPWKESFRVSTTADLPRRMNYFFKPLYGTDFILSGSASPNFLLNLRTGEAYDIPFGGYGDPGTSPDGEFITLLGGGLSWFAVTDILARAPKILLKDPGLRTYQSMGLLRPSVYRVLGAETSSTRPTGLIFRDYEKKINAQGENKIVPITAWQRVCDGKSISIPMLSKSGSYVSGLYDGTLRVFRIGPEGKQCEEVFDSKAMTGKADFSADDRFLLYVSNPGHPESQRTVDAIFLADLMNHQVKPIYFGSQLYFPGFLSEDRIAVYDDAWKRIVVLERTRVLN